jgi:hypothetical protein
MKKLNLSFTSNRLMHKFAVYLGATATVAMIAVAASLWLGKANASVSYQSRDQDKHDAEFLVGIYREAQTAEIDQLLADYHGALA